MKRMTIDEALSYLDANYYHDGVVGPCYALGYCINYTPAMWKHYDDEVPGVVFHRLNEHFILIADEVHKIEFLLRWYDSDNGPVYTLDGVNFNAYASAEGDDYIAAIAAVAEYACS